MRAKELSQVASSEEVLEALVTRLKAFGVRVRAEDAERAEEIRARRIARGLPVMREGLDWEEEPE